MGLRIDRFVHWCSNTLIYYAHTQTVTIHTPQKQKPSKANKQRYREKTSKSLEMLICIERLSIILIYANSCPIYYVYKLEYFIITQKKRYVCKLSHPE